MIRYPVYLEIADDGMGMAHVLDLPGCMARALTREEALRRLPDAVRDYHAWLRRHGEPAPAEGEPIELEVADESRGIGPFTPGDAAALFPPDQDPFTPEQVEHCLRLMAHSRADLLALVRNLPDDLLDWRPDPQSFTIGRLLRHIGNAEEWYVSRLVPPGTLPPEWEDDENLPIFEFLEMERRTAVARLRQLTDEERSQVLYPSHWTNHPEEAWTARKALRRFLEHEREHTAQIRQILTSRRRHLLAHLAAERSGLLWRLAGLDEQTLTEVTVLESWTVKDLLAHIAAWDRWELREMSRMLAGEAPDLTAVQDEDAFNAATVAAWRDRPLPEVLVELQEARAAWVAWIESVPEEEFFRSRPFQDHDWHFPGCLQVQWRHDAEHAGQIAAWREAAGLKGEPWNLQAGSKETLLAGLEAARQDLLAAAALVPVEKRATRPVCGEWTLKDLLGHVADWERVGVDGLQHLFTGRPAQLEPIEDYQAWNTVHARARRDQPWEEVWADFQTTHEEMIHVLQGIDQASLDQRFTAPWDEECTIYAWVYIYLHHDRDHAKDVRNTIFAEAGPVQTPRAKSWKSRAG